MTKIKTERDWETQYKCKEKQKRIFFVNSKWKTPGCRPHLRGPVEAGDDAMLWPVFIIEESAEGQTGAAAQVSGKKRVGITVTLWSNLKTTVVPVTQQIKTGAGAATSVCRGSNAITAKVPLSVQWFTENNILLISKSIIIDHMVTNKLLIFISAKTIWITWKYSMRTKGFLSNKEIHEVFVIKIKCDLVNTDL